MVPTKWYFSLEKTESPSIRVFFRTLAESPVAPSFLASMKSSVYP